MKKFNLLFYIIFIYSLVSCNNKNQTVETDIKKDTIKYSAIANGDRFYNLLHRKPGLERDIHYDIGEMFINEAMGGGVLSKLLDEQNNNLYLDTYTMDVEAIKVLYDTYKPTGKGVRFDFISLKKSDYLSFTGNISPTNANEFLYFIATPIDNNDQLDKKHYVIFNLKSPFKKDTNFLDDTIFQNIKAHYKNSKLYDSISKYSSPRKATEFIYYPWTDINNVIQKKDTHGNPYKEVEFRLGEVIRYQKIAAFFKKNIFYRLEEPAYKNAYEQHEKQPLIVGKYLPDTTRYYKHDYFDMGTLYP